MKLPVPWKKRAPKGAPKLEVVHTPNGAALPVPWVQPKEAVVGMEIRQTVDWHTRLFSPHVPVPVRCEGTITTVAAGPIEFETVPGQVVQVEGDQYVRRVYDLTGKVLVFDVYLVQSGVSDQLVKRWARSSGG